MDPLLAVVEGTLADTDGAWGYAVVFALAAIPWLEILLVIPPAIGIGLDPVTVGIAAFLGNVVPIYGIVAAHHRIAAWWTARRDDGESGRYRRAKRVWNRYGLPGLAIAAPIVTGVHLAAVVALVLGARRREVAVWMTASIALWTVVLVALSVAGVSILGIE